MTVTEVIEQIEEASLGVDELSHVPEHAKNNILLKLDEVEALLDEASERYGDESLEDDYGDD